MICFLIDDDTDDQEIFAMALERLDTSIRCVVASDGTEALEKLRQDDPVVPHYIFLDLNMPGMNGKQCLAEIKNDTHLRHIPVVIYSTSSEPQDAVETMQLGAAAFITKPSRLADLIRELSDVFNSQPFSSYS